jgi:hypothetical protein
MTNLKKEQYQGTCPICGVTLILISGNKLSCLGKHYICDRWEFEKKWDSFQRLAKQQGDNFNWDLQTDFLLAHLVGFNEISVSLVEVANLQEKSLCE